MMWSTSVISRLTYFLLVDHVFHQRMDFAVGQRIELECIGVGSVGIRRIVGADDASVGGNPIATPRVAYAPAPFDVGIGIGGGKRLKIPFARAAIVAIEAFAAFFFP